MAQDAPLANLRTAARLANGFMLDLVKLGRFGRDVVDAILLTAISQANVLPITRDPVLQRRYATLDQPPPDDLRRPVSISAVAHSLHVPFETARRRIAAMVEAGIVYSTPRGVIIPQAPLDSPTYRTLATAHYEIVRGLYLRLTPLQLFDFPSHPPEFSAAAPPVRLVSRLSANYLLRLSEPITENAGDLVSALILLDMIHANTEHLPDLGVRTDPAVSNGYLPDDQRRPVRVSTLSERLGIPPETVRRHLNRLARLDRCERTETGYIVPGRVLSQGPFVRYMLDNNLHMQRFFAGLAEYGITTLWDHEANALRGAA